MQSSLLQDASKPKAGISTMLARHISIDARGPIYICAMFLSLIVLAIPFTVDTVPPLLDYPIHLSRSYIIHNYDTDPFLKHIYEIDWRPMPNLASDILLIPLLYVFDIDLAGRILIGSCTLLNVIGVHLLYRANFGQFGWWPFLSVLPAYHGALSAGFLNYSIGVSLLIIALSITLSTSIYREITNMFILLAFSTLLLFSHVITYGLYIVFTFFYYFNFYSSFYTSYINQLFRTVRLHLFAIIIPLAIYLYNSLSHVLTRDSYLLWGQWTLGSKIRGFLMPVLSGDLIVDALTFLIVFGSLLFVIVYYRHSLKYGLATGAIVIFLLFLFLPGHMVDAAFISDRLTVPVVLVLIGSVRPHFENAKLPLIVASLVSSLLLTRTYGLTRSWLDSHEYYQRLNHAIEKIEPGSSVMISSPFTDIGGEGYWFWLDLVSSAPNWHFALVNIPTLHSLPALPLIHRSGFSQIHFVWADKQIISLTQPFQDLNYGDGGASTWAPDVILANQAGSSLTILNQADQFDYILFVYANHIDPSLRNGLATLSPVYADDDIVLVKHQTKHSWRNRYDEYRDKDWSKPSEESQ